MQQHQSTCDTQLAQCGALTLRVERLDIGKIVALSNRSSKPLYLLRIHPEFKVAFQPSDLTKAALTQPGLLDYCRQAHIKERILERFTLELRSPDAEWRYVVLNSQEGLMVLVVMGCKSLVEQAEAAGLLADPLGE